MNLIDMIKTAEGLNSLNVGDKILAGLLVAFIGMAITIIVLIMIWAMIRLISVLNKSLFQRKDGTETKINNEPIIQNDTQKEDSIIDLNSSNNNELVAAITCALFMNLNHRNFKIRHVSRRTEDLATWRKNDIGEIWK